MGNLTRSTATALAVTLAFGLPLKGFGAEQESAGSEATSPPVEESGPAATETQPSNGIKTLDAVAVRPVSFVSSLFSTGAFVLSLPFAAFDPAMDVQKSRENLIDYPYGDTFRRPLGDFSGSAW